jgi:hypothetical protein
MVSASEGDHPRVTRSHTMKTLLATAFAALALATPAQATQTFDQILQRVATELSANPFGSIASGGSDRCPVGTRYYERREGATFFGIKLGEGNLVWSGCLTDGEAAMSGAGTTNYSQPYRAPRNCSSSLIGNQVFTNCY